ARARPIEIGAVLENHVDERNAEIGEPAHDPRLRHAQHRGGQRIGDLVLHHLRRLSGKLGVDNHLHVGEVGDRIERHLGDGVKPGDAEEDRRETDQEDIARRPANDPCDHFGVSWLNARRAALRLLSASIRKVAETTTSSPLLTPSMISTKPSPRRPVLTARGSKRPAPFATSTTWRVPLSITALSGTAGTALWSASA